MREQDESETAYFKRRFAECVDEDMLDAINDQLRQEGYEPEKIKPRKSERKKEIQKQAKAAMSTTLVRSGGQRSAEDIVANLDWPTSVNGEVNPAFVAGMRYEAMNIIRGIRMAQELNRMGLEQAKPVIEMAKEMRQAEGQAAQVIAEQLAQVTMQSNQQILGAIHEVATSRPQEQPAADPMKQAFMGAVAPIWGQILQRVFSGFSGLAPQGQPSQGVAPNPILTQPVQPVKSEGPPPHLRPGEEVSEWTEA